MCTWRQVFTLYSVGISFRLYAQTLISKKKWIKNFSEICEKQAEKRQKFLGKLDYFKKETETKKINEKEIPSEKD